MDDSPDSLGVDREPDDIVALRARLAERERELQHFRDAQEQYQRRFVFTTTSMYPMSLNYGGVQQLLSTGATFGGLLFTPNFGGELGSAAAEAQRAAADRAVEAQTRALTLLEEHIGADALAAIQNGGAYPVKSKLWDDVVYLIPRDPHERIKVTYQGSVVLESCLVSNDSTLPWPDLMLQRIRAIELDESILFNTGVLHDRRNPVTKASMWARIGRLFKQEARLPEGEA